MGNLSVYSFTIGTALQNCGEERRRNGGKKAGNRCAENGGAVQFTTFKVRLYPTPEQAELFEKTFGCCRYIWNQMLSDQQRFYNETGAFFIPTPAKHKAGAPFLKEVDNQALIQEHNKLSQAFRVFFKDPEHFGHPKFKRKKNGRDSFTACNHKFESGPTIYTTKDGVRMTKSGIVKAKFSRRPQAWWKLKRITVDKTRTGKYYCYILYAHAEKEPVPVTPAAETTVGLKYSMQHFYVDGSGAMADPPRWRKQSQEKLAGIQRSLSRMQPGSKNYREALQKFYAIHEHIANQRRDYIHKESRRIANAWDAVCVRADDMNELNKITNLGNVFDSGYGMFRECLRYKLARQGKQLLTAGRYFPSTRICSVCGCVMPEEISTRRRTWSCPRCGSVLKREVNAAQNIKAQGLAQYFRIQERRESA